MLGVGEGLGGGGQRGGFEDGEDLVQDALLQPAAAEALAAVLGAIQLLRTGAHVAGAVAFHAGVAGLHQPAALAAAEPALQQRGPFPRRRRRRTRAVPASSPAADPVFAS